jgi:hypothetical protein
MTCTIPSGHEHLIGLEILQVQSPLDISIAFDLSIFDRVIVRTQLSDSLQFGLGTFWDVGPD